MIFNIIFNFVFLIFDRIIILLPDADPAIVSLIENAVSDLSQYIVGWNWLVPIDRIWQMLVLYIVVINAMILFQAVRWIFGLLSGGHFK